MKGRMSSILWRLVAFNVICLVATLVLAYGAGQRGGGLGLLDFGALPAAAGLRLWSAAFLLVLAVISLAWGATRVLHPLKSLADFSEQLGQPDVPPPLHVDSNDDFGFIADGLTATHERAVSAVDDQAALASLRERIAALQTVTAGAAHGDLSVQAAAGEDELGHVSAALNTTLSTVGSTFEHARGAARNAAQSAGVARSGAEAAEGALTAQGSTLQEAATKLAQLPPTTQQIGDNATAIIGAAHQAATAAEQSAKSANAAATELEQVRTTLASGADVLGVLRTSGERLEARLRDLSIVAERANVLALNAALAAARAAEATRTPLSVVEEFRDLAQDSSNASRELATLVATVRAQCDELLHAATQQQQQTASVLERARASATSGQAAATASQDAAARAEVITLAADRQRAATAAIQTLLRSLHDLGQAAQQHVRRAGAAAERSRSLGEGAAQALGALRTQRAAAPVQDTPPAPQVAAATGD